MPVSITLLQPLEGTDVVYEPIGPPKPGAKAQYRVSVWFEVRNTDPSKDATIDRIKLNGEKISNQLDAEVEVGMGRKTLAKNGGSVLSFQNIRGKVGPEGGEVDFDDTPVFTAPAPATMQLAVFLVGQTSAAGTASLNLKAGTHAGGALSWPGRGHDLGDNEAWSTSSDHVSGHQVFALDVVMQKYADGALRDTFPVALEAGRRESYVIYGQPVYAMANGVVGWTLGDQSEWSGVGDLKKGETTASAATGVYYGGGNQVFVKTGEQMWVIAHLQRGSIPADVKAGEEVRRGQYLGKVGYSGDSSHPHFHAHVKTRKPGTPNPSLFMAGCDDGFFRPMLFKELWSTPTDGLDAWTAEQWSKLDAQSAPDPSSLLSPGTKAPTWNKALVDKRRYVGIWHPAQHIELRVVRPSFDAFIEAFNFLTGAPNRFRLQTLDTFTENDRQYFIGNFRYGGTGSHFVSAFSNWEAFLADVEARHADGLELLDMCNWTADGFHWFSGVFGAGQNGLKPRVYTDLPAFQADVDNRAVKGEQLFALDTFRDTAGPRNWIGVFRKDAARSNLIHGPNWSAFTDTWSKQGTKTDWRRITDAVTGDGHWVGVIRPDPNKNGQILQLHTTWGKFTQACERVGYDGWRLVHVAVAGT